MQAERKLRFDRQKNIAHIRLEGPLSERVIFVALIAAANASEYEPGMARLWDFRDADLSGLDAPTLMRLARHSAKFPPGVRDVRVAIVTARPLDFGLAGTYEVLSPITAATTTRVFDNMEEAKKWITEAPAD